MTEPTSCSYYTLRAKLVFVTCLELLSIPADVTLYSALFLDQGDTPNLIFHFGPSMRRFKPTLHLTWCHVKDFLL